MLFQYFLYFEVETIYIVKWSEERAYAEADQVISRSVITIDFFLLI